MNGSLPHSMYRALYEHSMDAVILTTPDGSRVFAANRAACELFRMTETQICKAGRAGLVDEADTSFRDLLAERADKGRARGELIYTRGDGSRFFGEVTSAKFVDDRGEAGIVLIIRDITEPKRVRRELAQSEERYRTIFENAPIGLFRSTWDGRLVEANFAMARMFGYDSPGTMIREVHDIGEQLYANPEDRQAVISRLLSQPGDIMRYHHAHRRQDGSEFTASMTLRTVRDLGGEPVLFDGIIEDVTERMRAEDELRASEARFRSFVDHAMDAFFLHGENGTILDANRQACLNLGYSREELIGASPALFDVDLSAEFRAALRERVNKKGEVVTFASHHRRKDGSIFPVEVSVRPFPGGERIMQISTARDISERLRVAVDLHTLNRELRAISHCHHALLRAADEQGLLDEVCRIICDEAGYRMAWVGFVDRDTNMAMKPVAWAGVEAGYLADTGLDHWDLTIPRRGPVAESVCSGNIVYVQDIEHDPRMEPWRDMAVARGYRSSIAIPLKTGHGEVFGVLSIYAEDRNAYVLEEIRMLDELADDLAFGLDVLRIRRERLEAEAALQVKTEELNLTNMELRRLTAHREEIREQERMEIARNVHDELGQLLTALQMRLTTLALEFGKEHAAFRQAVKPAQELTEKAMKTARDVISALRPASLDMGLAVSLEWLAQRYADSTGIACRVKIGDGWCERLDQAGTIALYRIAQESLTNIARHAHAGRVLITLGESGGACELVVRDNGIGFDATRVREDAFGLIGIRERVAALGGRFGIDSTKGKGSELRVTLPLAKTRRET